MNPTPQEVEKDLRFKLWVKNSAGTGFIKNDDEMGYCNHPEESIWTLPDILGAITYITMWVDDKTEFRVYPR